MKITKADIDALPHEFAYELAEQCDPDGKFALSGYDAYEILKEHLDHPDIMEQVADVLSFIQDMDSQESEYAKRIDAG